MMRRRRATEDGGITTVVGAVLLLAIVVGFVAVANLTWVPAWVERHEAGHADAVRAGLARWGDSAEDHVASSLEGTSFAATLPVGTSGIPILDDGASAGTLDWDDGSSLTVLLDGAAVASVAGRLAVSTAHTEFPVQTYWYAFGALEVEQGDGAWVDLRSLVTVSRAGGGEVDLAVLVVGIEGRATGTVPGDVTVVSTIESAASSTQAAGAVRLVVEGVLADAWRTAFERVFASAGLAGESLADCGAPSASYCLDTDTNDVDTVDVVVPNVADGWRLTTGVVDVEIR